MTNEELEIVREFIVNTFINTLQEIDKGISISEKFIIDPEKSYIRIQYFYDQQFDKVYLTYEFDDYINNYYDTKEIEEAINEILLRKYIPIPKAFKTLKRKITIFNNYKTLNTDTSRLYLRYDTFSYWKDLDGSYEFLEERYLRSVTPIYEYWLKHGRKIEGLFIDFYNKILELNVKYDFKDNNNIPLAFKEYSKLYKSIFGYDLKPVEDSQIKRIYLQIKEEE